MPSGRLRVDLGSLASSTRRFLLGALLSGHHFLHGCFGGAGGLPHRPGRASHCRLLLGLLSHRYLLDLDFFVFFFDAFFGAAFFAFLATFLAAVLAVFFGAFAALPIVRTAFFTGSGVFLAAVLRTRLATDFTAVSASAPAAVASKSVIWSASGLFESLICCSSFCLVSSMAAPPRADTKADSARENSCREVRVIEASVPINQSSIDAASPGPAGAF